MRKQSIILDIKIAIDLAMTVLFILLMGYHLLGNIQHEWIGFCVFVLFLVHNALNWRWYRNLFKGKYTLIRTLQTIVNSLLWVVMFCNIISSFMLSRYIFAFLGITTGSVGRRLHMISTIWTFILISVHIGLHWQMFIGLANRLIKPNPAVHNLLVWISRIIVLALFCYGVITFIQRQLWNEMFLLTEFKFTDPDESFIRFITDYTAIMEVFVCVGYYLKMILIKGEKRCKKKYRVSADKE